MKKDDINERTAKLRTYLGSKAPAELTRKAMSMKARRPGKEPHSEAFNDHALIQALQKDLVGKILRILH